MNPFYIERAANKTPFSLDIPHPSEQKLPETQDLLDDPKDRFDSAFSPAVKVAAFFVCNLSFMDFFWRQAFRINVGESREPLLLYDFLQIGAVGLAVSIDIFEIGLALSTPVRTPHPALPTGETRIHPAGEMEDFRE